MKRIFTILTVLLTTGAIAQNDYSLQFDGVDDYVNCGNSSDFDFTTDITISTVINYDNFLSTPIIIQKLNSLGAVYAILLTSTGEVQFILNGTVSGTGFTSLNSINTITPNQWTFISCTYDGVTMKIFIDGQLDASASYNSSINITTDDLLIGLDIDGGNINQQYTGILDDIQLWNTALTQQEIQQYMNCPPTGNEAGLVGYWNFEEGTGTTAGDLTSNGNNGTLNGGVTWSTDVPPYNCCTPNPITSQPTNQSTSIGNNATISFTDNLTGATYQWQIDAGTGYSDLSTAGQFSGTDTQTLTISSTTMSNNNTLYRCVVTESSNCMDTTDVSTLTVIDNTSINELDNSLVKLYPNPTQDQITIDIKGYNGNVNVELYDLQGRLLETTTNTTVSLKKHAKGIYVLKVSYGEITEEVRVVRD